MVSRVIAMIWLAVASVNILLTMTGPHSAAEPLVMLGTNVCGLAVALLLSSIIDWLMQDRIHPNWPILTILALTGGTVVWLVDGTFQFWAAHSIKVLSITALISVRYNLVYFSLIFALQNATSALLSSNRELAHRERQLAEIALAEQQARLTVLQLQLNPHFLFNALNALDALTTGGRIHEASAMISRLSGFLRMTLSSPPGDETTLDDEIEAVQSYLEIEAIRFGDRININFDCACELERFPLNLARIQRR